MSDLNDLKYTNLNNVPLKLFIIPILFLLLELNLESNEIRKLLPLSIYLIAHKPFSSS